MLKVLIHNGLSSIARRNRAPWPAGTEPHGPQEQSPTASRNRAPQPAGTESHDKKAEKVGKLTPFGFYAKNQRLVDKSVTTGSQYAARLLRL